MKVCNSKLLPALALSLALFANTPCLADDNSPHITSLEQEILGQTYVNDELSARLSRMEAKAFGKASTDSDLSQRTDSLEDYAQKKLHKKPFGSDLGYETDDKYAEEPQQNQPNTIQSDDQAPQGSSPQAKYPHIDSLEKSILGETHTNDQVEDRLARMETKAFGKTSDSQALVDRTDALEDYAEKTLHKQSFAQEQKQEAAAYGGVPVESAAQGGGPGKGALMSMAASTLLSLAAGPLMPGFGGINMIPRSAVNSGAQPESPPPLEHPDDPAVKAATPPPAGANMQTKVGWCEMQLLGHTCHNMHLMARLNQLNLTLNYAAHKKPMDLMDDMDGIIKAVVAKKVHPNKAVVAGPN